jgi:hypothetical protein
MDEEQLEQLKQMGGGPRTIEELKPVIRAYFYGDPKVGKTDLVARICQELNLRPMWIYSDSGVSTVRKFPELADRALFQEFDSFKQIRLLAQARDEGYEPFCNYDTLVWDTVSTSTNNMLRVLVDGKKFPKEQIDPTLESWGHYRMAETGMKDTVKVLKQSGLHIFYLAHIRDPTQQDKEKKRFAIRPAGPEATYRIIAQEANLIGWLYKEKDGRKIQFEGTLQETAGTQIPTIKEQTYKVLEVPELLNKYTNS